MRKNLICSELARIYFNTSMKKVENLQTIRIVLSLFTALSLIKIVLALYVVPIWVVSWHFLPSLNIVIKYCQCNQIWFHLLAHWIHSDFFLLSSNSSVFLQSVFPSPADELNVYPFPFPCLIHSLVTFFKDRFNSGELLFIKAQLWIHCET